MDAFTAGSLIATVVGTGSPLTSSATATFINEYSPGGGPAIQSIGLPTTGASAFTQKGNNTGEGYLTTSADGHTATLAGYNIDAGSSTSSTNSLIGVVNPDGSINSSTVVPSGDTGGSVKATVSADGLGFWVATANYVRYVPFGNTSSTGTTVVTRWLQGPTTVAIGSSNPTASGPGNPGQLFFDGGAGAQSNGIANIDGPVQIGHNDPAGGEANDGLPNVGGQPGAILHGFPTDRDANGNFPTSNQIVISPDGNTIFVADGRADTFGGILEFFPSFAGSWVELGHAQVDATADGGLLGLVGDFSNPSAPILYGTTTGTSGNRIVKITGGTTNGNPPSFTFTTVETAAANTAFRGVALAPTAPGATPTTTALTVTGSPGSYPDNVTLSATVTGTGGTPTGYVSFQLPSGQEIGAAPLVGGTATLTPSSNLQVPDSGMITAVYTGDSQFATSSDTQSATITKGTTSTALTAQFISVATGVPDTLTAQVTYVGFANAAPTGTVTFWEDAIDTGINLGTGTVTERIVNVAATPTIEFLASTAATFAPPTGLHHIFAVYSGDSNFQTSQGMQDVTVVLGSTVTVTTSNASPTASGDSVTLTATVTGTGATPTGLVAFYDNSLLIAASVALDGSGTATTTLTTSLLQQAGVTLLPGLQSITAIYSGDATYFRNSGVYEQAVQAQAFGAGHVFVYRVGDGTTGLLAPDGNPFAHNAAIGSTIYIDEIDPAGVNGSNVVQSIILPSADGQGDQAAIHAVVGNGQQSGTEQMTVSGDGSFLFLVGYDTNPLSGANETGTGIGTTAPPIPTETGSISRAVARIDMSGNVQDVAMTPSGSGSSFGNFNAVYSPDGNQFYVGGNGGVTYFSSFSPSSGLVSPTAVMTSPTGNTSALEPMGPNLGVVGFNFGQGPVNAYTGFPISASSPTASLTTGITAAAATAGHQASTFYIDAYFTHLDNTGGTAPAGINTMYLSDDGPSFSHGSITKWQLGTDGAWTVVDVITAGSGNAAINFYYMSGSTVPDGMFGTVTLYVTYGNGGNSDTGPGELYQITDTNGYGAAIGTGAAHSDAAPRVAHTGTMSNEVYRGVAAFPVPSPSPAPSPVSATPVTGMPAGLLVPSTATIGVAGGQMDLPGGVGVPVTSAQAQQNVEFTATGATFTYPVLFGGTAGTPMELQASVDLRGATVSSILGPSLETYTVAGPHTYVSDGQFNVSATSAEGEISEDLI